jgi:hypothetical protein
MRPQAFFAVDVADTNIDVATPQGLGASRIGPRHCTCFALSVDIKLSMSEAIRLLGAPAGAGFPL